MRFRWMVGFGLLFSVVSLFAQAPAKRPLKAEDIFRMLQVRDPHVSPDGKFVAYTVTSIDRDADKRVNAVWMVNWEGTEDVQLTFGEKSASTPRWSPDGKYLAFLSARAPDDKTQVWVLDRRGGEARQLTNVKGEIDSYDWSPDSKRLVLSMSESDEDKAAPGAKPKAPKPIVLDRYHFKRDIEGYLTTQSYGQLYLFDIESKKLEAITGEKNFDESDAVWSPDGSHIAFISNHAKDPDQSGTSDIFIVESRAGAQARKLLTINSAGGQRLVWSPDGKQLAFLQGIEPKYSAYGMGVVAMVPVAGGTPVVLTAKLDRGVSGAEFTPDGAALTVLVEDDRRSYVGKVPAAGGNVERLGKSDVVLSDVESSGGHMAALGATDTSAPEIYAVENGDPRKLTSHNDALLGELQLGAVEDISFKSKDGAEIHGMVVKPPSFEAGKKYPTLLWIHGGPNGQDDHALEFSLYPLQFERQLLAAQGYVVLAVNYRGSSGRGSEFTRSIFADWGNKEVADLLGGIDYAVAKGIADPDRLGIGGWSYGGILTDYTIASDPRFKAAISGAGSANQISMYGSDQYIFQYNNEIGPPWKSQDLWVKISYPFFHADRIQTPTLFMGGEKDFNVPIIGSEQMFQALRTLGVPTQLVVYPGQFHLFTRPSYQYDRLQRYIAWYEKYLKK